MSEPDWPDELDAALGRFVYYGDNRKPGQELHSTNKFGNHLLRLMFDLLHSGRRNLCPPILIFTALRTKRAFVFRGLAVPGYAGVPPTQDLVAVWKSARAERFQNYRAVFTVLDAPVLSRDWINSTRSALPLLDAAPPAWRAWVEAGRYTPLQAQPVSSIRSRMEQLPKDDRDLGLLERIVQRFEKRPTDFESCAAEIAKLLLPDISEIEVTRPYRDGGRDAPGRLRVGRDRASIQATFALEAKCYTIRNGVGVREVSRLISRIRHREFGVLITTSYLDTQAYKEIVEDGHPVIVVCSADIVRLLRDAGYATVEHLDRWLDSIDSGFGKNPIKEARTI